MHYLVDGYNYAFRMRLFDRRDLEGTRRRVTVRLRPLGRGGDVVSVIWDAQRAPPGVTGGGSGGRVEESFARGREGADGEILARVRLAEDPRRYCVVSDDGDVTRPARQLGAGVLSVRGAEERLARVAGRVHLAEPVPDPDGADEKPPPPGPEEARRWLEAFGGE